MQQKNTLHNQLSIRIFWISLLLCLLIVGIKIKTHFVEEEEYKIYTLKAESDDDPTLCENIKNLRFSSLCYSGFINKGYDCLEQEEPGDSCLIAQAVLLKDDLFCDMVLGNKVPENLECRVSVFIERYSDEGLSDCCHIK